ncbi:AAA family ATPase [Pseudoroseicyclus sp. CXY001]|uniref:AAA family ATPase n=1 Tax=Pseudoroseicyclus sp. CXY001 TaxID=3242492 RepID=UPI0035709DE4
MILKGNQRGFGRDLALHLLNVDDNEHAVVHELRGFVADDLVGAFKETEAISLGTKCRQYLFSLSLNPPLGNDVPIAVFEAAIDKIEMQLGLAGQPRAVVFHEKKSRRHAHCVWSRIDTQTMRAINLPHFKRRLQEVARNLYQAHGWEMPAGFIAAKDRDPNSFTQVEAAQSKKAARDPKELKALFRECWERSDSKGALAAALREHGFAIAQGTRRTFVAVDADGKIYSLSRWTGAGAKALRVRLGLPDGLPSVEDAAASVTDPVVQSPVRPDDALAAIVVRQRAERDALSQRQTIREREELQRRQARLPTGLSGVWARLTGGLSKIEAALAAEAEAKLTRDRRELDEMIQKHLAERRDLDRAREHRLAFDRLAAELADGRPTADPRQKLVLPLGDAPPSMLDVELRPEMVLDHLSAKAEAFTTGDINRVLGAVSPDADWQERIRRRLLASPDLIAVSSDAGARFTTRDYQGTQHRLVACAAALAGARRHAVDRRHVSNAVSVRSRELAQVGAVLSDEQFGALNHVLSADGLSCVVGYAGAGKSTLLEAARAAWEAQGYKVYGAALSGKAADSLEAASRISSRTLASLESSWKVGAEPIASGSVFVIDEVGMVGTRQLVRVMEELHSRDCKVVLVGDPDQLQPIESGTPFRDLLARHDHARLTQVRRQKADWQRRASTDLANGHVDMALRDYADRGYVQEARDLDLAISSLADDYLADMRANPKASLLALAHRRRDVFALNQAIREGRVSASELKDDIYAETEHGPRVFASGDRILFTRNDASLGLRNGMLGSVASVANGTLRIKLDDGDRTVLINPRSYAALDHGYAVSIHKSQGCTVDRSFVLSSPSMDRHLIYVALTRHREQMRIYRLLKSARHESTERDFLIPQRPAGPRRAL